jgi:hypothetical protein
MRAARWGLAGVLVVAALGLASAPTSGAWTPRVFLHAHNCYPDEGRGADRLARALAATRGTVAIEQDVAWDAGRRQPVVSHDTELDGSEPTLEAHFFGSLAPRLDRALAAGDTAAWPLVVLHLDFKANEPAHHAARLGLWLRFYTLNGHEPNDAGWTAGYSFGTLDAVRPRWQAAIAR